MHTVYDIMMISIIMINTFTIYRGAFLSITQPYMVHGIIYYNSLHTLLACTNTHARTHMHAHTHTHMHSHMWFFISMQVSTWPHNSNIIKRKRNLADFLHWTRPCTVGMLSTCMQCFWYLCTSWKLYMAPWKLTCHLMHVALLCCHTLSVNS